MNVIVSNKYQTLLGSLNIDVIKSVNGEFTVGELIGLFSNFFYNKMIIDITALKNYEDPNTMRELSMNFSMEKVILLLDDSPKVNSGMYLSSLVNYGIYNFTKNVDGIPFLIDHTNSYKDVANYQDASINYSNTKGMFNSSKKDEYGVIDKRIIGFKNLTEHAGSTTLVYMLKKALERDYSVKAIEINNTDFSYFNDKTLESCDFMNANYVLENNSDKEVILIDLNDGQENFCTEVIYLIEPGIIKLNKLVSRDPRAFSRIRGKKIVLNKSVLTSYDVKTFERESGANVFYNLPLLDEKLVNNKEVKDFLIALGFSRINE